MKEDARIKKEEEEQKREEDSKPFTLPPGIPADKAKALVNLANDPFFTKKLFDQDWDEDEEAPRGDELKNKCKAMEKIVVEMEEGIPNKEY